MKDKIPFLVLPVLCLFSELSYAHVRWFINEDTQLTEAIFEIDTLTALIVIGGILFCTFCIMWQRHAKEVTIPGVLQKDSLNYWYVFSILFGISLIFHSLNDTFVAPGYSRFDVLSALIYAQLIFGVILILPSLLLSGLALFSLITLFIIIRPFYQSIDYLFEFYAAALALLVVYGNINKVKNIYKDFDKEQLALFIIRIGLGLQLVVLATHNKLLDPTLGVTFLADHPHFNFMTHIFGLEWFCDIHFTLAAGVAELCFGVMLIFGQATRFVMAIVAGVFITTSLVVGLHELIGHIPFFGFALLILLKGGGYLPKQRVRPAAITSELSPSVSEAN